MLNALSEPYPARPAAIDWQAELFRSRLAMAISQAIRYSITEPPEIGMWMSAPVKIVKALTTPAVRRRSGVSLMKWATDGDLQPTIVRDFEIAVAGKEALASAGSPRSRSSWPVKWLRLPGNSSQRERRLGAGRHAAGPGEKTRTATGQAKR